MANFSLWATFGLCLLKLCLTETQFNVSCRYGGVFHVEKNGRYSLTRSEAVELCRALNSTLSTLEQLKKAHELGFETCRYGFVVGHIVIPRINPYHLCAANHTGIYKLSANTTGRYDAYCYNATETRDKACEPIERLDTSFLNNQGEIVIDNADGSRYNVDGTRHSGESSTSGADDENAGSGSTHDTTPMDTSIRRSSPSYYGSATPVSQLPDHSSGGGEKEIPRKHSDYEVTPVSPDISSMTPADDSPEKDGGQYPASTTMASNHGAKQNDSAQDPLVYPDWDKGEDYTQRAIMDRIIPSRENNHEKESSATAVASPDGAHHEDPTRPPLPSDHEPGWGTEGIARPTDAPEEHVHHRTTASSNKADDDSSLMGTSKNNGSYSFLMPVTESVGDVNRETATKEPPAPGTPPATESERANATGGSHVDWIPGVFPDTEDHLNRLQTPLPTTVASPDGAHHEDPTRPPLPSDHEPGWGTEGIARPTDAPEEHVHHRTTASSNKADDDSSLMGTSKNNGSYSFLMPVSTDVLKPEDTTQELWAPRIVVTAVASPDGAHHEDPTRPPLPSDHEPGWGTEGIARPTDAPEEHVHHRTTASSNKADDDSSLMGTSKNNGSYSFLMPVTESVGDVNRETATKEPPAPGTPPATESERANATGGSHVDWIPGVFPDTEDHLNRLQTPLPTTVASPDGAHHEDPTRPPLPSDHEPGWGTEGIARPTDAPEEHVHHRTTASSNKADDDSSLMGTSKNNGSYSFLMPVTESVGDVNRETATKEPPAPGTPPATESERANATGGSHVDWIPGVFPDTEDHLNRLQTPLPTRSTSSIYGNQGPHKGHYEYTTFPGETTTTKIVSQPRSAQVPEWLIIVAALVALALILAVCIAVNSRRRCGQKKKLVINNGKGAVEDRKTSGLNGDASKSQEMVHLVHKEQSNDQTGPCDEFLTVNETQNHQELDMKSGV
ncbi:CD44 antigen isoform X2 [Haliaeetus albicilla]|uniref:CD44 antigen isoform X2 n=1 Tax=Haliaeetus albicilla TaxID=8969 RepID=UPI0037E74C41